MFGRGCLTRLVQYKLGEPIVRQAWCRLTAGRHGPVQQHCFSVLQRGCLTRLVKISWGSQLYDRHGPVQQHCFSVLQRGCHTFTTRSLSTTTHLIVYVHLNVENLNVVVSKQHQQNTHLNTRPFVVCVCSACL